MTGWPGILPGAISGHAADSSYFITGVQIAPTNPGDQIGHIG